MKYISFIHLSMDAKLPLYVSRPVPDQQAWGIDALNVNWLGLLAYVYPPTVFLVKVMQKIRQCDYLTIVTASAWPGITLIINVCNTSQAV